MRWHDPIGQARFTTVNPQAPASHYDIALADAFGFKVPVDATIRYVYGQVSSVAWRQPATEEQRLLARFVGAALPEGITFLDARRFLRPLVRQRCAELLRDNIALRPRQTIVHDGWPYTLQFNGKRLGRRYFDVLLLRDISDLSCDHYRDQFCPVLLLADATVPTPEELRVARSEVAAHSCFMAAS